METTGVHRIRYWDGLYLQGRIRGGKPVLFPFGDITCSHCRYCAKNSDRLFRYCTDTGEPLPAFDKMVGSQCPMDWEEVRKWSEEDE